MKENRSTEICTGRTLTAEAAYGITETGRPYRTIEPRKLSDFGR